MGGARIALQAQETQAGPRVVVYLERVNAGVQCAIDVIQAANRSRWMQMKRQRVKTEGEKERRKKRKERKKQNEEDGSVALPDSSKECVDSLGQRDEAKSVDRRRWNRRIEHERQVERIADVSRKRNRVVCVERTCWTGKQVTNEIESRNGQKTFFVVERTINRAKVRPKLTEKNKFKYIKKEKKTNKN